MDRSRMDIIGDILRFISSDTGIARSHLQSRANLTSYQMKEIMDYLIKHHTINEIVKENRYRHYNVTPTGMKMLSHIETMQNILDFKKYPDRNTVATPAR